MGLQHIRYAVAGSLSYLKSGLQFLRKSNLPPTLEISGECFIRDHATEIRDSGIELLVCLAFPKILTRRELDLFPKGCINLHAGLPKYRGRHPIPWMLIDGVDEIPVSIHFMDEGIDSGDIILQDTVLVSRDDNYGSVLNKVHSLGNELLFSAIHQIGSGTAHRKKQHQIKMGYRAKRKPSDSEVSLSMSSIDLHRTINALSDPMPNAFCETKNGEEIVFAQSFIGDQPGEVLAKTECGKYIVSTGDGVIFVETRSSLVVGDKLLQSEK